MLHIINITQIESFTKPKTLDLDGKYIKKWNDVYVSNKSIFQRVMSKRVCIGIDLGSTGLGPSTLGIAKNFVLHKSDKDKVYESNEVDKNVKVDTVDAVGTDGKVKIIEIYDENQDKNELGR